MNVNKLLILQYSISIHSIIPHVYMYILYRSLRSGHIWHFHPSNAATRCRRGSRFWPTEVVQTSLRPDVWSLGVFFFVFLGGVIMKQNIWRTQVKGVIVVRLYIYIYVIICLYVLIWVWVDHRYGGLKKQIWDIAWDI